MDVLVIYQFCTFGGVERVILNRARAFKKHGIKVILHVGYLSDSGALNSFKSYIQKNNLDKFVIPFLVTGNLDNSKYALTLIIDSPQVFDRLASLRNIYLECHTPYVENRRYLGGIPKEIKGIIVPSLAFKDIIQEEIPSLRSIIVLPNPIPDDFQKESKNHFSFNKRPLTYLARLDNLKNFNEAFQIFNLFKKRKDIMFIVIGEGGSEKKNRSSLENLGLIENSIIRDNISFNEVPKLISIVKKARGVFLSPSKGESFGLSAAEFICGEVPALLSNIPAHRALVESNEHFLYEIGDILSAKNKIEVILDNWENMSSSIGKYGQNFQDENFIKAWENFIKTQIL